MKIISEKVLVIFELRQKKTKGATASRATLEIATRFKYFIQSAASPSRSMVSGQFPQSRIWRKMLRPFRYTD